MMLVGGLGVVEAFWFLNEMLGGVVELPVTLRSAGAQTPASRDDQTLKAF